MAALYAPAMDFAAEASIWSQTRSLDTVIARNFSSNRSNSARTNGNTRSSRCASDASANSVYFDRIRDSLSVSSKLPNDVQDTYSSDLNWLMMVLKRPTGNGLVQ